MVLKPIRADKWHDNASGRKTKANKHLMFGILLGCEFCRVYTCTLYAHGQTTLYRSVQWVVGGGTVFYSSVFCFVQTTPMFPWATVGVGYGGAV